MDLFSNFTYYQFSAMDYYNTVSNPLTCKPAYSTCTPSATQYAPNYATFCPANVMAAPNAAPHSVVPAPFTFSCPDQREQRDSRTVTGINVKRDWFTPESRSELGFGFRNDNVTTLGLYLTDARNRYPDGTLSNDHVVERDNFVYAQTELRDRKLRVMGGLRGDLYNFDTLAYIPVNSGKAIDAMLNPTFDVAYEFTP